MKQNHFVLLGICLLFAGCAASYGPRGMNGGYVEQPINSTTYILRFDGPSLAGIATSHEKIEPLWDKRAQELCGSDDYYKEVQKKRIEPNGHEGPLGTAVIIGTVYCNSKFLDTRRQSADSNYQQFINLPSEALTYKEISPLWELLLNQKYSLLQEETQKLISESSEEETTELLATFARTNPIAEPFFAGWINAYPESYVAHYARSVYFHNIAWFKRGSGGGAQLTQQQQDDFRKYNELAAKDISSALTMKPDFCPAHFQKVNIYIGLSDRHQENKANFEAAKAVCPNSVNVYKAYLHHLKPRWHGSHSQMRALIDEAAKENDRMKVLEALYLAEEGDQQLFSNNIDKAIDLYTKALSHGEFAFIHHQKARALEKAKRYVESLEDYDAAIKMSPYYVSAYEGAARVLINQNNMLGTLAATSVLAALNNQDASTFEIQGDIFYAMRRYDDALVIYEKAAILSNNKAVHRHKIRMTKFQIDVRKEGERLAPGRTAI